MKSQRLVFFLVLAMILGGTACEPSGEASAAESPGSVRVAEGKATLTRNAQERELQGEQALEAGDRVTLDGTGSVLIDLAGGRSIEMASGSVEVLSAERMDLERGSVLVTTRSTIQVRLAGARATFQAGSVRFDALEATQRIAAYEVDGLRVQSGTQDVEVPRYWQVSVEDKATLGQAKPIQFSASDKWDRLFLARALEVDASLANLIRGLEGQLGGAAPGYLSDRLRTVGISEEGFKPFVQTAPSAQLLALAFAQEWRRLAPAEVETAFSQALALYTVGATWGLLAQQFDVEGGAFQGRLQTEINSILTPVAPAGGTTSPGVITPRPGVPVTRPAQPGQPVPGPVATPEQPAPTPSPGSDSLIPLLPDPLRSIIDELYGVVRDLLPIIG